MSKNTRLFKSFASSNFKLNVKPNVVLGDFKIRFVNEIKYLGVFFNSKLRYDEDINRQVRYLYKTENRLKTCFYKCSTKIKNVLFRTYCSSMYTCQLRSNFLSSSLKRIRVAYNNLFRFLHGLARYVSAHEQQVLNNSSTFDAIVRKMFCSFVYRCYESNSKVIFSLMASECFINSSYYKHYNVLFICNRYLVTFFFLFLYVFCMCLLFCVVFCCFVFVFSFMDRESDLNKIK